MSYNNHVNNPSPNRYSTSPTYREFNRHPYLYPGFSGEGEDSRGFANDRNLGRYPGHLLSLPRDLRVERSGRSHRDDHPIHDSAGSWSPAVSHETRTMGYDLQYPPTSYWPGTNHLPQPHSPAMDQDYPPQTRSPIGSEHSPTKFLGIKYLLTEPAPINYRGMDIDLPSMNTSHVVSV